MLFPVQKFAEQEPVAGLIICGVMLVSVVAVFAGFSLAYKVLKRRKV